VSVGVCDDTAHAHLRRALDKAVGNKAIGVGNGGERASDGENAVVNARDDLANAGADSGFVAKVGDVLTSLADDHTGFLGGDDSAQSDLGLVVLLLSTRVLGAIGVEGAELVGDVVNTAVDMRRLDVFGRHGRRVRSGVGWSLGGEIGAWERSWSLVWVCVGGQAIRASVQFRPDTARAGEGGAGSRTHREVVETVAREERRRRRGGGGRGE
jgi:hypothetical protein